MHPATSGREVRIRTGISSMNAAGRCGLLIFETDASVRDYCAVVASDMGCDLYSTGYVDNHEKVIREFAPAGLIIDVKLLSGNGDDMLVAAARHTPETRILLLAGDDRQQTRAAEARAASLGLFVDGTLDRPVSFEQLDKFVAATASRVSRSDD